MTYTFTGLQAATLKIMLSNVGFAYQRRWYIDQKSVRHITKTRQCGADWYFSLEALIDAIETGRNQNFIAPHVDYALASNRERIVHFASLAGVKIAPGDSPVILSNGAEIRFLDDRSRFVNFHGNAYISEYAWSDNPAKLFAIGRALAAHKKYRFTAYTTPSGSWEAYDLWLNENPAFTQQLSAAQALKQGSTLLNLLEVKNEFSERDFETLFNAVWPQEEKEVVE